MNSVAGGGNGGNGGNGAPGGRGRDGADGLAQKFYNINPMGSYNLPQEDFFVINSGCSNSEIILSKFSPSGIPWLLESPGALVPYLFPNTPSYGMTDTLIKIYYPSSIIANIGLGNTLMEGFISVQLTRQLPQIQFSENGVCVNSSVIIQSSTQFNISSYDWLIYENQPGSNDLHFFSSSLSQFSWTPNKSGSFMVRHRVQDSCCGWSIPVFSAFTVFDATTVEFQLESSYCQNHGLVQLNPTPEGGTFSGTGVFGNIFNPNLPPATYTIQYNYVNSDGCFSSLSKQVEILAIGPVTIYTPFTQVCVDSSKLQLVGTPQGGNFSGNGIVNGNQFDPTVVGPGVFTINYAYQYSDGCIASNSTQISVHPKPTILIEGIDDRF